MCLPIFNNSKAIQSIDIQYASRNGKLASYCFQLAVVFVNLSPEISGSTDEFHKSETWLVVKFYLNFYVFIYVCRSKYY